MWILNLVPDAWLHLAVLGTIAAGVVLYALTLFVALIPPLAPYREPARILSTLIIVAGVYFYGSYATEMSWRQRTEKIQAQAAVAEQAGQKANAIIDSKTQQRQAAIQERHRVVKQYITREITRYNDQCVIPEPFVNAHNQAAEAPKK